MRQAVGQELRAQDHQQPGVARAVIDQRLHERGRHERGVAGLGQRVAEQLQQLRARRRFGHQPGANPGPRRDQVFRPQPVQEPPISREDHRQQRRGVAVGTGADPQLREDLHAHLLGFVHQEHRADPGRGHVGPPSLAQGVEAPPTIVGLELHRDDVAQLAVEVGGPGLGPLAHPAGHVPQGRKPPGDPAQRHTLAGTGFPRDQREAPFLDELFDPPGELLDLGGPEPSLAGQLG
jgi:hypothetical protein